MWRTCSWITQTDDSRVSLGLHQGKPWPLGKAHMHLYNLGPTLWDLLHLVYTHTAIAELALCQAAAFLKQQLWGCLCHGLCHGEAEVQAVEGSRCCVQLKQERIGSQRGEGGQETCHSQPTTMPGGSEAGRRARVTLVQHVPLGTVPRAEVQQHHLGQHFKAAGCIWRKDGWCSSALQASRNKTQQRSPPGPHRNAYLKGIQRHPSILEGGREKTKFHATTYARGGPHLAAGVHSCWHFKLVIHQQGLNTPCKYHITA